MINYAVFPRSLAASRTSVEIIEAFKAHSSEIESPKFSLSSNEVLEVVRQDMEMIGFQIEKGKKKSDKIMVPVLFGNNGKVERAFEADGYHREKHYVLEVEAGRGVTNFQFLKDFFQAIAMKDVEKLCIAVRNKYLKGKHYNNDFDVVVSFFDTIFASGRMTIPLREVLIIGY